jgi:alanyl-tRNA synthetase
MNDRPYYTDSYTTEFSTLVSESFQDDEKNIVILDKTYFYPTSGGQPFDTGMINGIPVLDVVVRKDDGAIMHTLESLPEMGEISAVINWTRRFDHMQQHTGQHILSQAFIQVAGAQTVGFHLSDETVTIDLDQDNIQQSVIDEVEDLANEVVWQNRPVVVRWATREEAEGLALRKIPTNGGDRLRLIDIVDFDLTACGGTHVARTGEVGLIKVIKKESRNLKTRVHFSCGGRALTHYRAVNEIVNNLTTQLTTGMADLGSSITKLQENEKESRRELEYIQNQLDEFEAQKLMQLGQKIGRTTLITHLFTGSTPHNLRSMAGYLTQDQNAVALLGSIGERTQFVFARSADAPGQMKELLQLVFKQLNSGSGGGSAELAQGSAPINDFQKLHLAFEEAANELFEEIKSIG